MSKDPHLEHCLCADCSYARNRRKGWFWFRLWQIAIIVQIVFVVPVLIALLLIAEIVRFLFDQKQILILAILLLGLLLVLRVTTTKKEILKPEHADTSIYRKIFLREHLAPLPLFFSHSIPDQRDISVLRMLSSFYLREPYDDLHNTANQGHTTPRILVLSDYWDVVGSLRHMGLQAWQMSRYQEFGDWYIRGALRNSPIRRKAIHIAWAVEPVNTIADLLELTAMVREWGFVVLQLAHGGQSILIHEGFSRFPFEWRDYEIWRRSA